jgi:flagellar biosynthesis protein FlhB
MSILQLLVAFILFCWTTTTNYLNGLHIDTEKTYPLTINGVTNPYVTGLSQGPIDTSNQANVSKNVDLSWWWECTQQSSYHFFGSILHRVFNFFKFMMDDSSSSNDDSPLVDLFSFFKWVGFGLISNLVMLALFCIVCFMWIPGWFGGLTAYLPTTYYTASGFLKACKVIIVLFFSFLGMILGGWVVTIIPVIVQFFKLIYITWFKQIFDDPARFGNEFMQRMKQLIYIYIVMAVIMAFVSSELPNSTKYTIATVSGGVLVLWLWNV